MLGEHIMNKHENNCLGIGTMLRKIRKQMNLTILQVSKSTGIAEETIRRIELDKFEPKISTLEILSDFYHIDLIELLSRKRQSSSLFSEAFISKVNDLINKGHYLELKDYADETLNDLLQKKTPHKIALSTFLYAIKYIKYDPVNGQNDTIAIIEDILLQISPSYLNESDIIYPLPLEVSFILILSIMYRQNEEFNKAVEILKALIKRIHAMPIINDRYSDYLASAYINLAYTYHTIGLHDLVVSCVDECLSNTKINYTRIAISHLLFRKGLALFMKNDSLSIHILITSVSLMDSNNQENIKSILREDYNIHF